MADIDIAPELYSKIDKEFKERVRKDATIKGVISKINKKRATQQDITAAAERLGRHASTALKTYLTADNLPEGKMYWNIAEKTIKPLMKSVYDTVNTLAMGQRRGNDIARSINIGISMGGDPEDRIRTILGLASNSKTEEELAAALDTPVKTTALDYVDDFQAENAKVRNGMGFAQYVVREYDGIGLNNGKEPCQWCLDRAGTWSYQDAIDNGVFERHEGCGCTIEVVTEDDLGEYTPSTDIPF